LLQVESTVSDSQAKRAKKESFVLGQIEAQKEDLAYLDYRIEKKKGMVGNLKDGIEEKKAEIMEKEADIKSFEGKVRKMDREKKDAETEIERLKGLIGV
jgi:chromosome segregation ATPase